MQLLQCFAGPVAPGRTSRNLWKTKELKRWCVFNFVGFLGIGVQLAALATLHGWAGLHYLAATALAVESAILHNFLWHEHWTWAIRPSRTLRESLIRLARFNLTNGALSMGSNLLLMSLLVDVCSLPYLPANLLAISICSIASYFASDRYVFKENPGPENPGLPRKKGFRKEDNRA